MSNLGQITPWDENVEDHGMFLVVAGDGQKLASLTLKEDGTLAILGLFGRPIIIKIVDKNSIALSFEYLEPVRER